MRDPFRESRCERFHADGTRCTNLTRNADRWCRQPGCDGFTRRSSELAPQSSNGPLGLRRRLAATGEDVRLDLEPDEAYEITVSTRATDSFRYHHGGSAAAAEAQIRAMLEDFLVRSTRTRSRRGFIQLSRDGYLLVLTPEATVVTEYVTVHRERTWAQVRAGVRSRFRAARKRRAAQSGDEPQPPPARGEPLPPHDVPAAVDPATVDLAARARHSYDRMLGRPGMTTAELDERIRQSLRELASGRVIQTRPSGAVEIEAAGLRWLVSADARLIIGVRRARPATATTASPPPAAPPEPALPLQESRDLLREAPA